MSLSLRFAARSDVGLVRDGNEDSGYAGPRLLVVADGMGGHAAGEVASSVAVSTLTPLDEDVPGSGLLDTLAEVVTEANDRLRRMVDEDPSLEGMGTTLTVLLRAGSRLGLAHVGDSRGYLLRDGELQRITRDHTFVQGLLDEGRITADEADNHPQRALITRALDGKRAVEPDLSVRELRAGDRYLLCSDGLSGVVSDKTIAETLSAGEPEEVVEKLVELALRGGGPDNITCIVADVVDDETASTHPVVLGAAASDGVSGRARRSARTPAARAAAALRRSTGAGAGGGSGAGTAAAGGSAEAGGSGGPGTVRSGSGLRWLRRTLAVLVLLALLSGAAYGAYAWSQDQYYVAADGTQVAIFRGLSQSVGGITLSDVYERQPVELATLPDFERERVESVISARSLDDARRIVDRLTEQSRRCLDAAATASPTADPSSQPTDQPTGQPTAPSSPAPTSPPRASPDSSRPSPTPSATVTPGSTSTPGATTPPGFSDGCPEDLP